MQFDLAVERRFGGQGDRARITRQRGAAVTTGQLPSVEAFTALLGGLTDVAAAELEVAWPSLQYLRHESLYCNAAVYDQILRLDLPADARVLDVGSGFGMLSYGLAVAGLDVTAMDILADPSDRRSPLFRFAEEKAGTPLRMCYVRQDLEAETWDAAPETFDLVVSVDVLEHIRNAVFFLENCKRVLKPGGTLIVHTPNFARLAVRAGAFRTLLRPAWPLSLEAYAAANPWYGHVREYNPRELSLLLRRNGFEVLHHAFPRDHDLDRLRDRDGRIPAKQRTLFLLTEAARRVRPSLGGSQLVVATKAAPRTCNR